MRDLTDDAGRGWPRRTLNDGDPVEALRGGQWIPGTLVGAEVDSERGLVFDVNLDRPDAGGSTAIWTRPGKIRPRALPCGCSLDGREICQDHWRSSAVAAE
jgi:hypothetical protein